MSITFLLIVAVVVWGLWQYQKVVGTKKAKGRSAAQRKATAPVASQNFKWPSLGDFEFEVVGEANYQSALRQAAGDHGNESAQAECVAELVPEDDNEHDSSAVRVYVNDKTVGFLSRDDARSFRRRLGRKGLTGQTTFCDAIIVGGGRSSRDGKEFKYGIRLDMKPFDN